MTVCVLLSELRTDDLRLHHAEELAAANRRRAPSPHAGAGVWFGAGVW